MAPLASAADSTTADVGTTSVGVDVSMTVTSKDAVAEFPAESVAVHVTLVVPSGNVEPDGGAQLSSGAESTASVALTRAR